MKKNLAVTTLILSITGSIFLSLHSCKFSESGMMRSTGAVNELLIVTDSKAQWEGAFGDSLRKVFNREQVGLPQPEPMFDVINIASKHLGDLYQRYHNIFIAGIDPQLAEPKLEVTRNVWSEPQRVIRLSAPDEASFFRELARQQNSIAEVFVRLERERTPKLSEMAFDMNLSRAISGKFQINLSLPGSFYIANDSPDFMWIRHREIKAKDELELGLMIYTRDYTDTMAFNPNQIISWRNLITREYIPGPSPGSFMKISTEYIPPVFTAVPDFGGGYAMETRGIWEVENDYMGGAFISYTFVHPVTHKLVTLDGYVYNPNNDKKNYIRHMESIFWGITF
jgi:hypothetical protein